MRSKRNELQQVTLSEKRMKEYENFRSNLKMLRHSTDLSAENLAKQLGFLKQYRISDLEYGRAKVPTIDEIKIISVFFNVTIDQLLYKRAKIYFE
jgi:transcriptional regulator with XRE-family HTH domain